MVPRSEIQQILLPDGQRYTLALPPGFGPDRSLPLVVALHYAGHGTPFYGRGLLEGLVEPALQDLGALIAAPDCIGPDWTHPRSEAGVLALLDHLQQAYPVDASRTLIAGYSMGGKGAWYLAARHQDRFAAGLVMAGWPPRAALAVEWRIPVLVLHSRSDEMVPLAETAYAVRQLQARGAPVELVELAGIAHYETYRFVAPLQAALSWIENAWGQAPREALASIPTTGP